MLFEFLAALDLQAIGSLISVIAKVALGLGAVIFVHELGHFLVAKACGVKCEKFMIGFDIGGYKIARKWGETVYGIGILPLGGYVKMLGQDDDPAHIAEQMKKSALDASNSNAVPITGPDGETYYVDRRSYLAKSVPQRMAIISAGVIMNVIFAFIFAVIAYGMGVPYFPAIVSETVYGSPAWQAGIQPGDEIVQLGNRQNPTFMQLRGGVTLGDLENGIPCMVRRAADGEVVPITLYPSQKHGRLATVGITSPMSLTLMDKLPYLDDSPAARAKLLSPTADKDKANSKLKGGDTIVRVGDVAVENYRQFAAELARNPDQALVITVSRSAAESKKSPEATSNKEPQELQFEISTQPLHELGLVMEMGPITAVQKDSPAAKAGLEEGDVIELVDGKPLSGGAETSDGWNPITLPEYIRKAAVEGREVEFAIRRGGEHADPITVRVTPVASPAVHSEIPRGAPMGVDSLGIAYRIDNRVHAIEAGGPAAGAKIAAGDVITIAKIFLPEDKKGTKPEPVIVEMSADDANWPALVDSIQFAPAGTTVELKVQRGADSEPWKIQITPQPVENVFVTQRGFVFEPIERIRKAATFAEAVRYGWDETVESLTMVFRFLKKLGGQVPLTALGGPVTIAKAAGYSASEGLSSLLIFLTMLSANLAVINFLPIPLLDGGHMVFLAYEGLRGRPANERFVVALHTAGFVLIVGLMLFVLALDFNLIPRNL